MEHKEDCFHLGIKALIQNGKGEILLLQRPQNRWDIPGGRIHRNELLEEALRREIYEETGFCNLDRIALLLTVVSTIRIPLKPHDVGLIFATYVCFTNEREIILSDEHVYFEWVKPTRAAELLAGYFPLEMIEAIKDL